LNDQLMLVGVDAGRLEAKLGVAPRVEEVRRLDDLENVMIEQFKKLHAKEEVKVVV